MPQCLRPVWSLSVVGSFCEQSETSSQTVPDLCPRKHCCCYNDGNDDDAQVVKSRHDKGHLSLLLII